MYIHTYIHAYHTYIYTYIHTYIYTYHIYHTYIHIIHTYTYIPYIHTYTCIHTYTAVCKKFSPWYISVYTYMECIVGRLKKKASLGAKKNHFKICSHEIFMVTCLSTSSRTLPTMHSTCLSADVYQGLNSYIYIWVARLWYSGQAV